MKKKSHRTPKKSKNYAPPYVDKFGHLWVSWKEVEETLGMTKQEIISNLFSNRTNKQITT